MCVSALRRHYFLASFPCVRELAALGSSGDTVHEHGLHSTPEQQFQTTTWQRGAQRAPTSHPATYEGTKGNRGDIGHDVGWQPEQGALS